MARNQKPESRRAIPLIAMLGGLVLSYVFGAYTAFFGVAPYADLAEPLFAPLISPLDRGEYPPRRPGGAPAWQPTELRGGERGVRTTGGAASGLTFYTSGHRAGAVLIDSRGRPIHRWRLPFDEVGFEIGNDKEREVYWGSTALLSTGDVVALYTEAGRQPPGHGIVKVDRQSRAEWAYAGPVHSDVAVGPDGEVVTLERSARKAAEVPISLDDEQSTNLQVDSLVRLSKEGEVKRRVDLTEALAGSAFQALLDMHREQTVTPGSERGLVLDANAIEIVGGEFARHHEFAEPGFVLVTLRALDALVMVDWRREQVVWATRGSWWHPSDVDLLPGGDMLVFDQDGHGGAGLASRILRYDPLTAGIVWSYTGDDSSPLWTQYGGDQQLLPNGNVLITSSMNGRLIEVSPEGRVVWEFLNPARRASNGRRSIATIWAGRRISQRRLDFLEPGEDR